MNLHHTYFLILAASIVGPLALSFDKKVAFYKKWKAVFGAMLLPALFYILWDAFFAHLSVWFFNEKYITGLYIFNLPVEEVLFFFVVPYCCTFIYECVRCYFPLLQKNTISNTILKILALGLLIIGLLHPKLYYTASTSVLLAIFIAIVLVFSTYFKSFNNTAFLISYAIILVPFLIINGLLTAIPVITYNNAFNTDVRIYTIPVEDVFYGMLLVLMNIVGYEKIIHRKVV